MHVNLLITGGIKISTATSAITREKSRKTKKKGKIEKHQELYNCYFIGFSTQQEHQQVSEKKRKSERMKMTVKKEQSFCNRENIIIFGKGMKEKKKDRQKNRSK